MKPILTLCLTFGLQFYGLAQNLQYLQDIYQPIHQEFDHVSGPFYPLKGNILFFGLTFQEGYGFWSYDGKQATRITDSGGTVTAPAETEDGFYYLSTYDVAKYTLYKHGGNPGVTIMIDDVQSNSQNNVPSIASINGKVFYPDWGAGTGYELWVASDSSGSGALLLDGNPGTGSTFPIELTEADSLIYYRGGSLGRQLWRSDGTPAGTFKLLELPSSNPNIQNNSLKTIGNKAYFLIRKYTGETELWISDGTVVGTMKASNMPSSEAVLDRFECFFLNGKYVFLGVDPQDDRVWVSTDGTIAGTEILHNFPANTAYSFSNYDNHREKTILNGSFFFFRYTIDSFEYELWKSDGTKVGTEKVLSLGNSGSPHSLAASKNLFFFLAQNKLDNSIELWSSDGTAAGTKLTKSLGISQSHLYYGIGEATDSSILFRTPFYEPDDPQVHYRNDGTAEGTYPIKGINALHLAGSYPSGFVEGPNNTLFFRANDNRATGVWQTSPGSVFDLSRIDSTLEYSQSKYYIPVSAGGTTLWFSNDSTLKSIDANGIRRSIPFPPEYSGFWCKGPGGIIYFLCKDGQRLWRTDGTLSGTFEVLQAPTNSTFYDLEYVGDSLYFMQRIYAANEPQYIWSSDGTAVGSSSIATVTTGSTINLRNAGDQIAYSTNLNPVSPYYRTLFIQGYPNITFDGVFNDDFAGVTITDNQLFVLGSRTYNPMDSLHYPFWVIENGMPVLLQKFQVLAGYYPYNFWEPQELLYPLQDKVLFGAGLRADNAELWSSDGTANGTFELRDLNPAGSSNPDNFIRYKDHWLFTANDGMEVSWWATDGTATGTFKIAALASVKDYFVPQVAEAYLSGNQLFFSMNDGIIGQEPWILVLEDSLEVSTLSPLFQKNALKIWPNPALGDIKISLDNESGKTVWIRISNLAGQTIYAQKQAIPALGPLDIILPKRQKGVHFLQVTAENGKIWTQKLLISE